MKSEKNKTGISKITISTRMPEKEGLYTGVSERDFKDIRQIEQESNIRDRIKVEEGSMPTNISFEEFHEEACRRAEFREKVEGEKRHVEIKIDTDKPVAIAFLSDLHVGNAGIDYELLKQTSQKVKDHPLAYCITGGDITDTLIFDYGEEVLNMQEQYVYMNKMLRWIGSDKIIAGISGNHDMWSRKQGPTNYIQFVENVQRPLLRGVSFIDLTIGNTEYNIMAAHKFRGESIYNPTHQENRANIEMPGSDIVLAGHTHKPGESIIYQPQYGGGAKKIVLVNGKTFKKLDAYGKDNGFTPISGEQLGCNWIILNNDKKMVRIASSNEEMIETMGNYF